mmetsp:Transcript_9065/g.32092  ORF Transcript_9065/g.32092 Transcript_9065/m.32092 type:complete len:206 (-) Transcript_9065:599-1216(-)
MPRVRQQGLQLGRAIRKLRLRLACVILHRCRPRRQLPREPVRQEHSRGRQAIRRLLHRYVVHEHQLKNVLYHAALHLAALVRTPEPLHEVGHGLSGHAELQDAEDQDLHLLDVLDLVLAVCDVHEVADLGRVDLLELRRDQHPGHADESQIALRDVPALQKGIHDCDHEEDRLGSEVVLLALHGVARWRRRAPHRRSRRRCRWRW